MKRAAGEVIEDLERATARWLAAVRAAVTAEKEYEEARAALEATRARIEGRLRGHAALPSQTGRAPRRSDVGQLEPGSQPSRILQALQDAGGQLAPTEIGVRSGVDMKSVRAVLSVLRGRGLVENVSKGLWRRALPNESAPPPALPDGPVDI